MFLHLSVSHSVHRRGRPQCMLGCPPGPAPPPGTRHPLRSIHPWDQPPPGADTPWDQAPQKQTPREQAPPGSRHTPTSRAPREQAPPSRLLLLRTVRILLECECILVDVNFTLISVEDFSGWKDSHNLS